MYLIKNLVEYYDELFPVTETKKSFFLEFTKSFKPPVHFLSIQCGTGLLENLLSRQGHDVTGIENAEELLQAANLRRRSQLMFIRFFKMLIPDMTKFLGKAFYNVIYVLNNRLMFFPNAESILAFMVDAKKLLAQDGVLVFEVANFEKHGDAKMITLPTRESVRTKLFTEILTDEKGHRTVNINLENSSEKIIPILNGHPVYAVTATEIEEFAEKVGFTSAEFYADFERTPFTGNEDYYVVVIK
ncbi:class I SAM-dependent methyltransferase [Treponema sp.]|uniref:class I SAM-dependent methyltransferase n=1 Tax=Treponema sp. TaxID=166 RepID=UPI00298DB752|nr:class I SAM-dependent methyltransferase [Treponema sp.]MCQ2242300.1 class I SAM-dependent methyltransferase [Treponema sp.]